MKKTQLFSLLGFLVGWGAPVGALFLRFIFNGSFVDPLPFIDQEWSRNPFFYWYMLIGTCSVLTVVGFLLGQLQDSEEAARAKRNGLPDFINIPR